jgi:hypothetical protein
VQILKNEDQREIDLGYRLEQPIFFEKFWVLRMAHKGKVRV